MAEPVKLRSIPLWEANWDEEALRKRAGDPATGAERAFNRGFRMKAWNEKDTSFPHFGQCEVPGLILGDIQRSNWPTIMSIDPSGPKRKGTAIVCVKVHPQTRRRYPVEVRFGAWRSKESADHLEEMNRQHNPMFIMVENNGYQQALIDWVSDSKDRYTYWMKLEATTTTDGNKPNELLGLPAMDIEFSHGGWCFPLSEYEGATPEDADPKRAAWARLAHEFRYHPIASTSDGVMATWFCRQGIEMFIGGAYQASAPPDNMTAR